MKALYEFSGGYYKTNKMPILYDKLTARAYDINLSVREVNIRNGTEVILI